MTIWETTDDERVVVPAETVPDPAGGGAVVAVPANAGVPTQVANPKRASWRTYVQAVLGFIIGANIVLPIVQGFLVQYAPQLGDVLGPVYGYIVIGVNFAILVLGLLSKLVALLMANPAVNDWIAKHLPFLAPIRPAEHRPGLDGIPPASQ